MLILTLSGRCGGAFFLLAIMVGVIVGTRKAEQEYRFNWGNDGGHTTDENTNSTTLGASSFVGILFSDGVENSSKARLET